MTRDEINEAIENVAGGGRETGMTWHKRAVPLDDEIAATRQTIRRFLELMPEDATVQDLREAIEGVPV